jgi:hypothetical protein
MLASLQGAIGGDSPFDGRGNGHQGFILGGIPALSGRGGGKTVFGMKAVYVVLPLLGQLSELGKKVQVVEIFSCVECGRQEVISQLVAAGLEGSFVQLDEMAVEMIAAFLVGQYASWVHYE